MVAAAEFTDLLDRGDVLGLLDDTDHRPIAARIAADPAFVLHGHIAADPAEPDPLGHL